MATPTPTCATTASCSKGCRRPPPRWSGVASASSCAGATRPRWRSGSRPRRRSSSATRATCATSGAGAGRVAKEAGRQVVEVEGEVVVPVALASDKAEIGARTLRPRILRLREEFLHPLRGGAAAGPKPRPGPCRATSTRPTSTAACGQLRIDRSVPPSARFRGGTGRARRRLEAFLENRLGGYATGRNEPVAEQTSHSEPLPPFRPDLARGGGACRCCGTAAGRRRPRSFLEELIVRRELSHNFVTYNPAYDSFDGLPRWARATLDKHRKDRREHLYGIEELEAGRTHDPYFNAAMREMRLTGFMHNYMRMYWGKKILEYSRSPEEAYATTLAPQQQALPLRPRPQLLRQRRLALRPARPPVAGTPDLRPSPLHERQGPGTEVRHQGLCEVDGGPGGTVLRAPLNGPMSVSLVGGAQADAACRAACGPSRAREERGSPRPSPGVFRHPRAMRSPSAKGIWTSSRIRFGGRRAACRSTSRPTATTVLPECRRTAPPHPRSGRRRATPPRHHRCRHAPRRAAGSAAGHHAEAVSACHGRVGSSHGRRASTSRVPSTARARSSVSSSSPR